MPIEVGIWGLGSGSQASRVKFSPMKADGRLEDILDSDIAILDPRLLVNWTAGGNSVRKGC